MVVLTLGELILVPTSSKYVADLAPARALNPKLRIIILPNRIHSATNLYTVREALKNLDAIILPVMVPQKNLFVNFSTLEAENEYQPIAQAILNNLA
jgi:chromosome partitioning protein